MATTKTTAKKRATSTAKMSGAGASMKISAGARKTARRNNVTTNRSRRRDESEKPGFTIIEVVLVLAIAGLIFLMVFIALPALQRAQRDTQRRQDFAKVNTALVNYMTNNNQKLPAAGSYTPTDTTKPTCTVGASGATTNSAACFVARYLNNATATANEFLDPSGEPYQVVIKNKDITGIDFDKFDHKIYIVTEYKCGDESSGLLVPAGKRDFAVFSRLEGNGIYCQNNGV